MKIIKIIAGVILLLLAAFSVVVNVLPALPDFSKATAEDIGAFTGRCGFSIVLIMLSVWAFRSAARSSAKAA